MWWLKLAGVVLPLTIVMTGSVIGFGKWLYTRASTEDIALLDQRKEDKETASRERAKLERKIDASFSMVRNIRDNVIMLMTKERLKPKPLPEDSELETY